MCVCIHECLHAYTQANIYVHTFPHVLFTHTTPRTSRGAYDSQFYFHDNEKSFTEPRREKELHRGSSPRKVTLGCFSCAVRREEGRGRDREKEGIGRREKEGIGRRKE